MKIRKAISQLTLAALVIIPCLAHAVTLPALEIQDKAGDTGASLTATTFDIDATALAIITDSGSTPISPEQVFTLNSTGAYSGGVGNFSGTFSVDGGLLTGEFTDLAVIDLTGSFQFIGAVTFTGGSLMGPTPGSIDGTFSGSSVVAKLGPVVPVPAAVWLFSSGLLGLVAVARRKKAAA
jgi:hypothetical protein